MFVQDKASLRRQGRHAQSRDHMAIGRRNIFRLQKAEDRSTFEFVETISFNSMNDPLFATKFQKCLNQFNFFYNVAQYLSCQNDMEDLEVPISLRKLVRPFVITISGDYIFDLNEN
jgi:hypothetical protein